MVAKFYVGVRSASEISAKFESLSDMIEWIENIFPEKYDYEWFIPRYISIIAEDYCATTIDMYNVPYGGSDNIFKIVMRGIVEKINKDIDYLRGVEIKL